MSAINYAPKRPDNKIELRRWWNQICINALSLGIAAGCSECHNKNEKLFSCCSNDKKYLICTRCDHRNDMTNYPERGFIGFTKQS